MTLSIFESVFFFTKNTGDNFFTKRLPFGCPFFIFYLRANPQYNQRNPPYGTRYPAADRSPPSRILCRWYDVHRTNAPSPLGYTLSHAANDKDFSPKFAQTSPPSFFWSILGQFHPNVNRSICHNKKGDIL